MGLKIAIKKTKGNTKAILFNTKFKGISPTARNTTGNIKKGIRDKTSYLGKDTTHIINTRDIANLTLASIL
jgi:hypothetical protein